MMGIRGMNITHTCTQNRRQFVVAPTILPRNMHALMGYFIWWVGTQFARKDGTINDWLFYSFAFE